MALLTGELYVTTVLTNDGRNPKISGNGAFASYESGTADAARTRIVRLGPPLETVAELATTAVAFDRSGRRLAWLKAGADGNSAASEIVVRDLVAGTERSILGPGLVKSALVWSGDDQSVLFVGASPSDQSRSDIYSVREGAAAVSLTDQPGFKTAPMVDGRGATLVYTVAAQSPLAAGRGAGGGRGGGGGGGGGRGGGAGTTYGVVSLADKTTRAVSGTGLTLSSDGSTVAWLSRDADTTTLNAAPTTSMTPTIVRTGRERIDALALSPDGKQVAYQLMTNTDWEIYVSATTGSPAPAPAAGAGAAGPAGAGAAAAAAAHRRVTRDIQHDLLPRFLSNTTLIGLKGEARHRRSYLYDLNTGTSTRLFANNTIRTISPEYVWIPSADARFLILQAERDGDTVSAERDISVVDLTKKISLADLQARLDRQFAAETDLRQRMTAAYKPLEATVRQVLARSAVNHVYEYEKTLFDFDSKYITQPGNLKAISISRRPIDRSDKPGGAVVHAARASGVRRPDGKYRLDAQGHGRIRNSSTSSAATSTRSRSARRRR